MNVVVYSTKTCATCYLVVDWLKKNGIAYTKKNTDEDAEAMAEFMQVNDGTIGVPFTVITDDSGDQTKLLGFDQARLKAALNIKLEGQV